MRIKRKLNGGEYKKGTALSYQGVLDEISSNIEQMKAWSKTRHFDNAYKYQIGADVLLGMLEIHNCGKQGGFDEGQNPGGFRTYSLEQRYKWVANKRPKKIKNRTE